LSEYWVSGKNNFTALGHQDGCRTMAKIAHIQGDVVVHVLIDKTGHVANAKATSGHPMLIQAALSAVKQWDYKPFLLNGEPAEN
jgi:protein TonB